jgi:serine/threonine protein kinase
MAQEFIEGKSAAQLIENLKESPKISWQLGLRVAFHITQALDFTRQHRLVHGNVTPKNILVRGADQPALLNDLRLLKALTGSRLQASVMEHKRAAERTYMAPEQADGGNSYVDFLCDLYSLGAIVYNLITGQPIFRSDTLQEAIAAIKNDTPTRPRKLHKAIPRDFEFVVMRMLAKRQEDRYQSPTEVLDALRPIIKMHNLKI